MATCGHSILGDVMALDLTDSATSGLAIFTDPNCQALTLYSDMSDELMLAKIKDAIRDAKGAPVILHHFDNSRPAR